MFKKEYPSFNQIGGMFGFFFTDEFPNNFDDVARRAISILKVFLRLLNQGIYFAHQNMKLVISTKHTKKILDEVINKVKVLWHMIWQQ